MATVNLLPDVDIAHGPTFTLSSGSDIYALLDDDVVGTPSGEPKQIYATATGKRCILGFQDFDDTGVASIDSVQAVIKHNNNGRGATYALNMAIQNSSGTFWAAESSGTLSANVGWLTKTFTARETSTSGGSAWTNSDLDDIQMKITLASHSGGTSRVGYVYFIVTYTEAVTDNAIFFGTNF